MFKLVFSQADVISKQPVDNYEDKFYFDFNILSVNFIFEQTISSDKDSSVIKV